MTAIRRGSTATFRCRPRAGPGPPALLLALTACGGGEAAVDGRVVRGELAALEQPATLARWRELHPGDRLWSDTGSGPELFEPYWCARADSADSAPAAGWTRRVWFALPRPGADLGLPHSSTTDDSAGQTCVLALVVLSRAAPDSVAAVRGAGAIHDLLVQDGEAAGLLQAPAAGADDWVNRFYVRRDSLQQLTATTSERAGARVIVAGWTPAATRARAGWREDVVGDTAAWEGHWQREAAVAIRETGAEAATGDAMLALLAETAAWRRRRRAAEDRELGPLQLERFRATLAEWLDGLRALPSDQQAAGLFAADIAVAAAAEPFGLSGSTDSSMATLLASLGIRFSPDAGGLLRYRHTLLTQARMIDTLGAIVLRTTVRMLQAGFDTGGACTPGSSVAPLAIRLADSLLTERPIGPSVAELHLLLALAHRDQVGAMVEPAVSRHAALAHYDSALRLEPRSPLLPSFWTEAYRLSIGLRPRRTTFRCVLSHAASSP